jgi:hypothetical protein
LVSNSACDILPSRPPCSKINDRLGAIYHHVFEALELIRDRMHQSMSSRIDLSDKHDELQHAECRSHLRQTRAPVRKTCTNAALDLCSQGKNKNSPWNPATDSVILVNFEILRLYEQECNVFLGPCMQVGGKRQRLPPVCVHTPLQRTVPFTNPGDQPQLLLTCIKPCYHILNFCCVHACVYMSN